MLFLSKTLHRPYLGQREQANHTLTVIQAVAGYPNKKATLFIISTVKKERHSPWNFLCPIKDRAFPTGLYRQCRVAAVHKLLQHHEKAVVEEGVCHEYNIKSFIMLQHCSGGQDGYGQNGQLFKMP